MCAWVRAHFLEPFPDGPVDSFRGHANRLSFSDDTDWADEGHGTAQWTVDDSHSDLLYRFRSGFMR